MSFGLSVRQVIKGTLKTLFGDFDLYRFLISNDLDGERLSEHLALVKGDNLSQGTVLYRINSACITSEIFNCQRCDCKWQLDKAMEIISNSDKGIITYHPSHEGRGFGLGLKLMSYNLMDKGMDSSSSYLKLGLGNDDIRDFRVSACILDYFQIKKVSMLGNNKRKIEVIQNLGYIVENRFPLVYEGENSLIKTYLEKKSYEPDQDLLRKEIQAI